MRPRRLNQVVVGSVVVASFTALACHDETGAETIQVPAVPTVSTRGAVSPSPLPAASVALPVAAPFVPVRVVDSDQHAMGTHVALTAFTTPEIDEAKVRKAFASAVDEIRRIETLMTTWRPDSELSKVNAAAGVGPIAVGPETYDIVAASLHTSAISEGTFDITFESLHGLWKFDQDWDPHPPADAEVKAKLPLLNYHHVHLDEPKHTIYLDQKGVRISLGGIAKGYAVDKAAKVLEDAGITSFFVQAGGDLYTRGKKPDGSDWSTGVRDPRGAEGSFFALLAVTDHAFSTAGDYERSYIVNGRRYHHIIDPRTGYPATASRSVTIWAKTALVADELDDAVFILGPEKGLALVESQDDVGAVIVDAHNKVWVSKRLQGKLQILREPTDGL
jgi:FAD:protein FMN transferase